MREYFVNENLTIKAQTLGIKNGEKLKLELIMLEEYHGTKLKIEDLENKSFEDIELKKATKNVDKNKELTISEDSSYKKVIKDNVEVQNDRVEYKFKIEELVEQENIRKVNYIVAWIDLDGDGIREYDEAIIMKINHKLAKGNLRIGIFFDGTGNDISNKSLTENSLSNVRKLFEIYPNQLIETSKKDKDKKIDEKVNITNEKIFPQTMCAYVRGVGSISSTEDKDWFTGGAFGSGGIERVQGMLYYINIAIEEYVKEYQKKEKVGYYPINLEFDIFGFSRGAALARHFVNVIKEHGVDYNKEFYYNPAKIRIKTLNIFDTVASFGKPGNNINIGFDLHIKPSFIVDKVNHFLADDEFRENFPAHLISNNNEDYPTEFIKDKFEELVFLGAHSDIGGGYPEAKFEHNVFNNELSKYYLRQMYNKCKEVGVPLNDEFPKKWIANEEVTKSIEYFNKKYQKYSNLKVAHKKLREIQAYLSHKYINYQISNLNQEKSLLSINDSSNNLTIIEIIKKEKDIENKKQLLKDKYYFYNLIDSDLYYKDIYKEVMDELLEIFQDRYELEEFIEKSNYFQDKYVHRPYSNSIGMSPKIENKRYHRIYYTTEIQKDVVDKQEAEIFYSNANVLENKNSNIG